ncbi:unnamed protein product [Meloidogyne enterolobii]|uniref:Uncharacterized protein n=1 Tax=Meloidogyne enterolobii TaxID=390850 RepID=A0ACB1AXM9_MELEN
MVNTKQPQKLPQSSPTIATTSATTSHSTTSSTSSNSSSYSRSPIYSKNSPLKRKEFSESRRKILQDQKNEEEQQKILEKAKEAMRWQQQRAVDTVEEVSQLGQAALEQMAILEELEFEDFERKTKISDRLCTKNVPSSSYVSLPTSLATSSTASSTRQESEINNGATARKSLNTGENQLNKQSQNHYSPKRQSLFNEHKQQQHFPPQNKLEQTTCSSQQFFKQKSPAPILDKNKLFENNNKTNTTTNNKTNTPPFNSTTKNSTPTNLTTINITNNKTNTTNNTSTNLTTNKNTTNNSTTTNKINSTTNKTNTTTNKTNTTTNSTTKTNTTTNKTNIITNKTNSTINITNNPPTNKTSTNSSQHSLKSLATSIIRYDDETREKEREQREKQNIKTTTPQTSPGTLFSAQSPSGLLECKTCGKAITNVLQALGASFHPACFRCQKCSRCLDGIPFTVEQNGEGVICMDDYERYFVTHCRACKKAINAVNEFGKIVRIVVEDREYHIQCYCCEGCGMQLSNEPQNKCYPIGEHLLCRRCHTLWRRMGALETDAAVSDL